MQNTDAFIERGYHMTEADVRAIEDKVIADHRRAEKTLAVAKSRLHKMADEICAFGADIKTRPAESTATIDLYPYPWLKGEEIHNRAADVVRAMEELQAIVNKATDLHTAV